MKPSPESYPRLHFISGAVACLYKAHIYPIYQCPWHIAATKQLISQTEHSLSFTCRHQALYYNSSLSSTWPSLSPLEVSLPKQNQLISREGTITPSLQKDIQQTQTYCQSSHGMHTAKFCFSTDPLMIIFLAWVFVFPCSTTFWNITRHPVFSWLEQIGIFISLPETDQLPPLLC